MSNSSLVEYVKISPNKNSPRNHKIDTITIHCVVGQLSVQSIGAIFAPRERQASSNYGIGYDGSIGMYVDESDRSWCTSSSSNDHRAITIEVASEKYHPYEITKEAYDSLVKLCADICKRNNIEKLLWKADKKLIGQTDKQNMTVHRWFANKSCPGDYLYNLHGQIANDVNNILLDSKNDTVTPYRVGTGWDNNKCINQIGAYNILDNAINACTLGYNVYDNNGMLVYSNISYIPKIGDKIKLKDNATIYNSNNKFAKFIYNSELYIRDIKGDRIVISTLKTGSITGATHIDNIIKS